MSENCSHNCSSCGETCASRTMESFRVPLNPQSSVKKVIGVVSGKGGVGKSLVTSLMACKMRARNNRVGILDADITGPSIPKAFGIHGMVGVTADQLMLPRTTSTGIEILSSNLILEHETDPVIWRGPVVGGVIKQFWSEALWKDIDYMFVDMPPGTGDVPLTVFQSLPLAGIIIVTSPQELVSMIVAKAVKAISRRRQTSMRFRCLRRFRSIRRLRPRWTRGWLSMWNPHGWMRRLTQWRRHKRI